MTQSDHTTINTTLVVLPALNEAENIARVVRNIKTMLPTADVLVINDGSSDQTGFVAYKAGAIVLSMPYNVGIGAAVQTGFKFAHTHGYKVVLRLDGDGQHSSDSIPTLLNRLAEPDVDMVIGSRWLAVDGDYGTPLARRFGIFILTSLLSIMTRQRITDPTSGFAAFNQRAIALFARLYPHDYPEPEAIIVLYRSGLKLAEVPVKMLPREHGESAFVSPFQSAYYMLKVILAILINMLRRAPQVDN